MPSPDGNLGPVWGWDHTETGVWLSQGCRNDTRAGVGEKNTLENALGGFWGWAGPQTELGLLGTLLLQARGGQGKTFIL